MKPWHTLVAGLVGGILLTWFFAPRPGPDTTLLDALRDSVAVAQAQATRDSARLAALDDTLDAVMDTLEIVMINVQLMTYHAHQRAAIAETQVRTVLDSLGASTAALDTLIAAHTQEVAAKDAEIAAHERAAAILWRRVELSDTLIADLRGQIARDAIADAEEDRIREKLQGQVRSTKVRERVAEGVAIAAITWKILG